MVKGGLAVMALAAALALAPVALADDWWPHAADATWTYEWTDSQYNTTPTAEKVTVKEQKGKSFTLAWTTEDQGNPDEAITSIGERMVFQETNAGILNTDWSSTPPPPDFPILCPQQAGCANALSSTLYYLIWGTRSPVLQEPVLQGVGWNSAGGARGDVVSTSSYEGRETVTVPAFPDGIEAAKVRTDVTQAGALGDPYGSGVRTVWWVHGVGPVKMTFEHAGGGDAALTTSVLKSTNQTPTAAPSDLNYFPLEKGTKLVYSWTNTKHLKKASVQEFVVDDASNLSARFSVKDRSGPIRLVGAYGYTMRLDGVTNIAGATKAATFAKFPPLGPSALPKSKRRHFFTPFDLMAYGMNPILPAYPAPGASWATKNPSRDFSIYGVNGSAKILGIQSIKVPAGTFQALVVRSALEQPGFKFGSGVRTSWFAPGKGLVKLVFRHGDRSISTVQLLKK